MQSLSESLHALSQEERLAALKPVSWVHVPKVGSTIMHAVMHLPGVCPNLTAKPWDQLCSSVQPDCNGILWLNRHGGARSKPPDIAPAACPGIQRWCLHDGFNSSYLTGQKGHGLIMLRSPEQRLLSGYYNPGDHHGWKPSWKPPRGIAEYVEIVQGVVVKQLSRDGDHFWWGPPTQAETDLAVSRLRDGFAFVGIQDEYELSVCLLHAMFGNECKPREFIRFHKSWHRHSGGRYDLSQLKGFKDKYDGAIFAEGMDIFKANLRLYNVSKESCEPCFRRGKVSKSSLQRVGRFVSSWGESA